MMTPHAVILFLALVSFLLSAANVPARVNWTGLGLALWVLAQFLV